LHLVERCLIWLGELDDMREAIERTRGLRELAGPQELNGAVDVDTRLRRQLGRNASQLLELPNGAVRFAAARQDVEELEPDGDIRRRDGKHVLEALLAPAQRSAISADLELGECVAHTRTRRRVAAQLLEDCSRVGGAAGERVKLC